MFYGSFSKQSSSCGNMNAIRYSLHPPQQTFSSHLDESSLCRITTEDCETVGLNYGSPLSKTAPLIMKPQASAFLQIVWMAWVSPPILAFHTIEPSTPCRLFWTPTTRPPPRRRRRHATRSVAAPSLSMAAVDEIRQLRVAEIKRELEERQISVRDVFEKEELVQRLVAARERSSSSTSNNGNRQNDTASTRTSRRSSSSSNNNVITAPLNFAYMDSADIDASDGYGITVEAGRTPFAAVELQVGGNDNDGNHGKHEDSSSSSFTLSLLLDTACSGLLLRPSVQQRHNLPSLDSPVSVTGAGGLSPSQSGLTKLPSYTIGNDNSHTFAPLDAVTQDIDSLPPSLDGILGLSFLAQFAAVELDFTKGLLHLYPTAASLSSSRTSERTLLTQAPLHRNSRGIFAVDVCVGGNNNTAPRGPVRMLVDTGASCSLLSWKGVADLGLDRASPQVCKTSTPYGAMGSDSVAIALTHGLNVSSKFAFVGPAAKSGRSSANKDDASESQEEGVVLTERLPISVGNVPFLDALEGEKIGGILGADALRRCGIVRMSFRDSFHIALFD